MYLHTLYIVICCLALALRSSMQQINVRMILFLSCFPTFCCCISIYLRHNFVAVQNVFLMLPFAICTEIIFKARIIQAQCTDKIENGAALLVVVVVVAAVDAVIHSAEDIRHRKAKKQQLQKPQLMGRHKYYTTLSLFICIVYILVCVCSRPFPNTLDAIIFACSRIDDTSFCLSVSQSLSQSETLARQLLACSPSISPSLSIYLSQGNRKYA